jgi:NADPH-ferrihemoprotein reductase
VAPFRGFVQERVALARKAKEKNGPDALKDWAPMYLFYGCRRSDEDFLFQNDWPAYQAELDGKFIMRTAFSREMTKPDGGKVYVQDQLWDERNQITPLILDKRAYVYICCDAHSMSKAVEGALAKMMGEVKGGAEAGAKELKLLKDRNVSRRLLGVVVHELTTRRGSRRMFGVRSQAIFTQHMHTVQSRIYSVHFILAYAWGAQHH